MWSISVDSPDRIVEIRGDPALSTEQKGICCSLSSILGDDDRAQRSPMNSVDQA